MKKVEQFSFIIDTDIISCSIDRDYYFNYLSISLCTGFTRSDNSTAPQRRKPAGGGFMPSEEQNDVMKEDMSTSQNTSWKRILLLIIAITVHNIPGIYTDQPL